MRAIILSSAAAVIAAAAGCVTSEDSIDPKASYPELGDGQGVTTSAHTGELAVRTRSDEGWHPSGKDRERAHQSRYVVYDASGRKVKEVRNSLSAGDERLVRAELPPGRYLVRVEDPEEGDPETFWVTISAGELTLVDLADDDEDPPTVE